MGDASIGDLRARLRGPLFEPDDAGYADEVAGYNVAARHRPPVVVGAERVEDVVAAVEYATAHQLPVRVQSTGHGSFAGVHDGVFISTRRLRALSVDPQNRTVRVGAGVVWRDVIDAVSPHGLAGTCGSAPGVGVVGYLLGGGASPIGRTMGFAVDQVTECEVVTADGSVRTVNPGSEPDLFWAVRGGRIAAGIVTSATMNLFPLASLYGGGLFFGAQQAEVALRTWAEWAPALPDSTTTSIALLRTPDDESLPPPLRGRFVVHIRLAHLGDDEGGEAAIAPLRELGSPLLDTVGRMPYAAIASIHMDPPDPNPVWGTSRQLREFPPAAVDAILEAAGPDVDLPLLAVELRQLGGAFAAVPRLPDAVSGRDAALFVLVLGVPVMQLWETAVPAAAASVLDRLGPWTLRGPQANFVSDPNNAAELTNSWQPPTHRRLVRIKTAYDPADTFRFGGIRPDR